MWTSLLLAAVLAASPGRCSAPWTPAREGRATEDYHAVLLASTDVIARVEVIDSVPWPRRQDELPEFGRVQFRVLEVLKGRFQDSLLLLPGEITRNDDFNPSPVPYDAVRPEGLRGSCFAYGYRRTAQYLLLLRLVDGQLTPYWAPIAPVNEQLRGARDPWLQWVRLNLG